MSHRDSHISLENSNDCNAKTQSLDNKDWSRNLLQRKFAERDLEELFSKYELLHHKGYFTIFLIVQTSMTIIHVSFLIFHIVGNSSNYSVVDTVAYLVVDVIFWFLAIVVFNRRLVTKRKWLPHLSSILGVLSIVIVDTILPIYHTALFHTKWNIRPAYSTHALLACHIYFPEDNNITPMILGATTALMYFANLYLVTYRESDEVFNQITADGVFLISINVLGMFYRHINEIFVRRTFLDKRACVESTLKLNYEKEREEQLMLSILPRHLASKVREDLRGKMMTNNRGIIKEVLNVPYTELYVERHNDVSILYADVVNYTKMTSSLPVNRLVEILNELFGKFDEASEKHKVLRIKYLGDCYYCVSGVPQPNPDHAKSCVELGLEMIKIIKDVRDANNLSIDMRIGVHSGSIFGGILGKCKWQYDIWSKDVIIANHMEQSGVQGMVHITKQTLDQLGNAYNTEPGLGHLRDALLAKFNIETFLIVPENKMRFKLMEGAQTSIFWKRPSQEDKLKKGRSSFERKNNESTRQLGTDFMYNMNNIISGEGNLMISRRRNDIMNSGRITSQRQVKMADVIVDKVIEKLPLGKYNQWFHQDKIQPFWLTFKGNRQWEMPFLKQPDPLFKYYLASALFVFSCIILVQSLVVSRWSILSVIACALSGAVMLFFLPLTWTHFIWNELTTKDNAETVHKPENKLFQLFYSVSLKVIWNAHLRMVLYITVIVLLSFCLFTKLNDLLDEDFEWYKSEDLFIPEDEARNELKIVFGPWQLTEGFSLAVLMSFLFFRIHFHLKLALALIISGSYIYCICSYHSLFEGSETWNPDMPSITAHILSIIFLVLELHLVDRQTEFTSRLDYCWKKQLEEEKNEVADTRSINKILLQNILPIHVAEIYLNKNRYSNELYHENYDCVSVMFASLTNYSLYNDSDANLEYTESQSLNIFNRIICSFDDALLTDEFERVEKIKVAGWSYMAACGLAPGSKDSVGAVDNRVVLIIARFAAKIMRVLETINSTYSTDFGLRIGIAHGAVTAGVVGSQKPYYDIWGDAVNVASRMDSTGKDGRIQVPELTAEILQEEGVNCWKRGSINIKGKGNMNTYFVRLTEDRFLDEEVGYTHV